MSKYIWASFFILVYASISMASELYEMTFEGKGFTVQMSKAVTVVKRTPVEDFDLYTFNHGDEKLMTVYLGFNPSFPQIAKDSATPTTSITGKLVRTQYAWEENGKNREVLIQRKPEIEGFPLVHTQYSGLTTGEAVIADRIISSIREKH